MRIGFGSLICNHYDNCCWQGNYAPDRQGSDNLSLDKVEASAPYEPPEGSASKQTTGCQLPSSLFAHQRSSASINLRQTPFLLSPRWMFVSFRFLSSILNSRFGL